MTMSNISFLSATLCAVSFIAFGGLAQNSQESKFRIGQTNSAARQGYQSLVFTTPAYRAEALRVLVVGANEIAGKLNLSEALPIVQINLTAAYVSPPRLAQGTRVIGNITTSNYVYAPFFGGRFSLVRTHLQEEYHELQRQFLWPMSRLDTNVAYQSASQLLNAVSINVQKLNQDCSVTIRAFMPEGDHGAHFVPVYWILWSKEGNTVASVELLEPAKTVRQMHISSPEYILRKPLEIQNLDYLLSQTNPATGTNAPGSSPR
jgi:hypothetical protein